MPSRRALVIGIAAAWRDMLIDDLEDALERRARRLAAAPARQLLGDGVHEGDAAARRRWR